MGAFVGTDVVRITDGDEWVEIKSKLGAGDRARFSSAIYEMAAGVGQTDEATRSASLRFNLGQVALVTLRLAITSWSYPQKVSEAAIEQIDMDEPIWGKVLDEINTRNPTLMELTALGG